MALLNVTPVLDALGGTQATHAKFRAQVMRARRPAIRVTGPTVTMPEAVVCNWDGTVWDFPPAIIQVPVDCYWNIVVTVAGQRLEIDAVLPGTDDAYDLGALTTVTPDSATPDTSTVAQYAAVTQQSSMQIQQVQDIAAQVADTAQTLQALIGQANTAVQAANALLDQVNAAVQTFQTGTIDGDAV